MRHLLVRTDATTSIGSGHFTRSLALAQEWQRRGGRVLFLGRLEVAGARARLERAGIEHAAVDAAATADGDLRRTLAAVDSLQARCGAPWILLDGYSFGPRYQQELRRRDLPLLVLDDTAHLPRYHADLILNQNAGAERLSYATDADTALLLGPRYALLRPEFLRAGRPAREVPERARRVLVTLGGSDPANVTATVVGALQRVPDPRLRVEVVLGGGNPHGAAVRRLVAERPDGPAPEFEVLRDVTDMRRRMASADVAISAAGSTCWELAFMGLPTLLVVTADNQKGIARSLHDRSAAIDLGWYEALTGDSIRDAVMELVTAPERRRALGERMRRLVDGRGAARVVDAMLKRTRGQVTAKDSEGG